MGRCYIQEKRQPYGEASRGRVFDLALYKTVDVQEKHTDRYKRIVAVITLPNGETLQAMLLRAGLAWVYPSYCKNCLEWKALEEKAQKDQRGL